jgi:release factor glutamine methyltransferase
LALLCKFLTSDNYNLYKFAKAIINTIFYKPNSMTYTELRDLIKSTPAEQTIVLNDLLQSRFDSEYVMMLYKLGELELTTDDIDDVIRKIDRYNAGEPLQYISGVSFFYHSEFIVNKNVLIPRPETEELVDLILNNHAKEDGLNILEIGTGSGCISISLSLNLKNAEIDALDISKGALEVAGLNNKILKSKVHFHEVDFLNENTWEQFGKYDIIVSNPPYIALSEKVNMSADVLNHEPHTALFVESENALIFYEKMMKFGLIHLNPKGKIYAETSQYQQLEKYNGFEIELEKDMSGNIRFLKAELIS